MSELIYALFIGLVQGITEWLPISSTAHLVLTSRLLERQADVALLALVHLATLLALCIYFKNDFLKLVTGQAKGQLRYIILASIPIAIVGFFFKETIEATFQKPLYIAVFLFITAIFLYATKYVDKKGKLTQKNTFFIGLAQAAAVFPGISRSGITLAAAQLQGIEKTQAATFAFLLAIPAITGASLLELPSLQFNTTTILAAITAFFTAYLTLKWLMAWIKMGKLHYFSYYCAFLGFIFLFL